MYNFIIGLQLTPHIQQTKSGGGCMTLHNSSGDLPKRHLFLTSYPPSNPPPEWATTPAPGLTRALTRGSSGAEIG